MADSLIWHNNLLPSIFFYHISASVTQYVGTSSFGIMWYSIREYQHAAIQICGQSARSNIPHERRDPHRHLCTGWTVADCTLPFLGKRREGSLAYATGLDSVCSVTRDCQRALLASLPQSSFAVLWIFSANGSCRCSSISKYVLSSSEALSSATWIERSLPLYQVALNVCISGACDPIAYHIARVAEETYVFSLAKPHQ